MDRLTVFAMRAKAGDRGAIDDLVDGLWPEVWRLCRYLGSPADPDDLAQEAFERLLRSLHRFRADGPVRAWAMSITRRVCADSVRRTTRQRRLESRLVMLHSGDHHRDESWQAVDDLLSGLDTERREAFVLTQLVGLSYEETADLLECPVGTIRSRVARARMQLIDAGVPAEVISA
jgi:RNA polymerase sigma-70 factor (ECF subfamily)